MGLFSKFFSGLQKTQSKLSGELKRIVSRSPKFTEVDAEELEAVLLASDMGCVVTEQIVDAVREQYQSSGGQAGDVLQVAQSVVETSLGSGDDEQTKRLAKRDDLTVVSLVGVNGAGKTTTAAKLANRVKSEGANPMLAACDTFRAAAIEQLNLWGNRLDIPVVSSEYGADPASVAHDAVNKTILCDLLGLTPADIWAVKQGNGCVTVVDIASDPNQPAVVTCLNLTSHFGRVIDRTAAGAL